MFKLQKRAIRIIANSINTMHIHNHYLNYTVYRIIKLSHVLTLQTMKVYHKFRNNELPVYMQTWPVFTNNEIYQIHVYNTRMASDIQISPYVCKEIAQTLPCADNK